MVSPFFVHCASSLSAIIQNGHPLASVKILVNELYTQILLRSFDTRFKPRLLI